MKNTLLPRYLGCGLGFFVMQLALSGFAMEAWASALIGAAILAAVYMAVRMVTRALTLAFDLVLLGLPKLFLEAWLLMLLSRIIPGITLNGYWPAMGMLLAGLLGMAAGKQINSYTARASGGSLS